MGRKLRELMGESVHPGGDYKKYFDLVFWQEGLEDEKDFSKLKDDGSGRKLEAIFEKHFSRYSQRAAAPYAPQLRRLALTLPESMRAFSTAKGFEKLQDFSVTETEKDLDDGIFYGRYRQGQVTAK